jgi:hypothetical protein
MSEAKAAKGWQLLNGNQLKMLAVILMVFDHLHQMFIAQGAPTWFTALGRLVAPIFLFTLAEGFHYTRNRKRYMLLMLIGSTFMITASAILQSIFPHDDIALINNIFSTFLVATIYMTAIEMLKSGVIEKNKPKIAKSILIMLAPIATAALFYLAMANIQVLLSIPVPLQVSLSILSIIPNLLSIEGGFLFVVLAVLFYLFRSNRILQVLSLLLVSIPSIVSGELQALMILAAIPILMYNGQRGKGSKYFFYIFYPAHIYLFYMIAWFIK